MKDIRKFIQQLETYLKDEIIDNTQYSKRRFFSYWNKIEESNKNRIYRGIIENKRRSIKTLIKYLNDILNSKDDIQIVKLNLIVGKLTYSKFNKISDLYIGQDGGQLSYSSKSNISLNECFKIVLIDYLESYETPKNFDKVRSEFF